MSFGSFWSGIYVVQLAPLRQTSATVSLSAANPPTGWSAYYPFRADATDANGSWLLATRHLPLG
jgi:hypothetical protein